MANQVGPISTARNADIIEAQRAQKTAADKRSEEMRNSSKDAKARAQAKADEAARSEGARKGNRINVTA